ncbi:MAG: biopolymer transporter ExbD, partial [Pseudomonadota bacterium]
GERVTPDGLSERIARRIASQPDQRVLIRPTGGIDMQRMISLIDRLAAAGAKNIALMPGGQR